MPTFRSLTREEEQEIDRYLIFAMELVPIVPEAQEEGFLIVATHIMIEALREGQQAPSGVSLDDVVLWLGILWGEELCRVANWNWGYLSLENDFEALAVVDQNKGRACFPMHLIANWIQNKEQTNDCMTLFAGLFKGKPLAENGFVVLG